MAGFSEDTRVKIPALTHLTRIGYTYRSLHSLHLDPETNIDIQTFSQKLREYNKDITDGGDTQAAVDWSLNRLTRQVALQPSIL